MVFKTIGNKSNPVILFFHAMGVIGESSMPVAEKMKEKTLKRIMWCDDDKIKPYFIEAGKNLTYGNLRRQLADSLEDKPFPELSEELQKHIFWEFGSIEEHFKYRNAVMQTYIHGNFPVFEGFNHMQYQIQNPEGFARMLKKIIETDRLPELVF
ncbi:MAG: hypothetical protein ACLUP8_11395 [Ruminococcus sp.]|uniref:hypothetical protein n=1 Tax=Ruminococcus sp. TaxID=41978 RepID=UPI00399314A6